MDVIITAKGQGQYIYDETIDLTTLGELTIRRGSHVESTADAQWTADMSPVHGPVLGPFPQRSDALTAEHEWLEQNWLLVADSQV